jgi:hypothetical protein
MGLIVFTMRCYFYKWDSCLYNALLSSVDGIHCFYNELLSSINETHSCLYNALLSSISGTHCFNKALLSSINGIHVLNMRCYLRLMGLES